MTRIPTLFALLIASNAFGEDELEDRFEHRWFEIEMIVFERLDALEINTPERLVNTAPRRWPAAMIDMLPIDPTMEPGGGPEEEEDPTRAVSGVSAPYLPSLDFCLGYPELPFPEPELPRDNEFGDELDALEALALDEAERLAAEEEAAALLAAEEAAVEEEALAAGPDEALELEPEPVPPPPTPAEIFADELADYEARLLRSSYRWLDARTMDDDLKTLNRQSTLRPILHGRWRQPVPTRDAPEPIYLSSETSPDSPAIAAGLKKVEGFVTVTVGRYLHFAPTLWYHADTLGMTPIVVPAAPSPGAFATDAAPVPYMELNESRRMRSETLHYLDHPKLAVLVRIDPIVIEPEIQVAWETLQALEEGAE